MQKVIALIGAGILLVPSLVTAGQEPRIYERRLKMNISQQYVVQTPEGYVPDKKYPLLIAVHDKSGSARDLAQAWSAYAARGYILLCPQFDQGFERMDNREDVRLMQVLLEMQEDFPYNEDQVFLAGFSEGGEFVSYFAFKRPMIIQGAAMFAIKYHAQPGDLLRNRKVRFLLGVGGKNDRRVDNRVKISQRFEQELRDLKYDITFKIYPLAGKEFTADMKADTISFFDAITAAAGQR